MPAKRQVSHEESRPQRVLAFLRDHPGTPFRPTEIADALGVPQDRVERRRFSNAIAQAHRAAGAGSPWRYVSRPQQGAYVFDPDARASGEHFEVLEQQADDFVVLRDETGKLWAARPLTQYLGRPKSGAQS